MSKGAVHYLHVTEVKEVCTLLHCRNIVNCHQVFQLEQYNYFKSVQNLLPDETKNHWNNAGLRIFGNSMNKRNFDSQTSSWESWAICIIFKMKVSKLNYLNKSTCRYVYTPKYNSKSCMLNQIICKLYLKKYV